MTNQEDPHERMRVDCPATGSGRPPSLDAPAARRLRLDEQLCYALYSAGNAVTRAYRPLLRRIGLTYPQYVVMMALWEHDDITVTDLATRTDLPAHGLSPVLDRLHQDGLLDRHQDPHDRRIRRLTLTARGRALEQHAVRAQARVVEVTQFSVERLDQLRDELHLLTTTLRSTPPHKDTDTSRPSGDAPLQRDLSQLRGVRHSQVRTDQADDLVVGPSRATPTCRP